MAVFGRDFYGLSKYGASVFIEFDVEPFEAVPEGYNAIGLSWNNPAGDWERLRLLVSRFGYAVNENDGDVLLDTDTTATSYRAADLAGGCWYYFTLYVQVDGTWHRAGATSALAVKDTGSAEMLWEQVPRYFRWLRHKGAAVTDDYVTSATMFDPERLDHENIDLRRFLDIVGWGLDFLRAYHETLRWANDPARMHLENLDRQARELGTTYEYAVPSRIMRSKVGNAALLARKRGTLDGLRDVVQLSTGYDIDLTLGPNLMLNEDQASFANPTYAEWNPGVNYAEGERAHYMGQIFAALVGGAYGTAQKPPTPPTWSNTWWTRVQEAESSLMINPETNTVSTWQANLIESDGDWTPAPWTMSGKVLVGMQNPHDETATDSNALMFVNFGGQTADMIIRSVADRGANGTPQTDVVDPDLVVKQAIPVPHPFAWRSDREYYNGDLVISQGQTYRALGESTGVLPSSNATLWERVGADERPVLTASMYTHGVFTGTAGTGGVAVNPLVYFFDSQGNEIGRMEGVSGGHSIVFDTFNSGADLAWDARALDYGSGTWTVHSGTWDLWPEPSVAFPMPGTQAVTTLPVPAGFSTYSVAVTFDKPPVEDRTQALVLRWVDANNHIRITRTKVEAVRAGVVTVLATISGTKDGDRISVDVDDAANTLIVRRNGTAVTGTLTGINTSGPVAAPPYRHGIAVL